MGTDSQEASLGRKNMGTHDVKKFCGTLLGLMAVVIAIMINAQPAQAQGSPPPIGAPLLREGTFAVRLQIDLAVGMTDDEVEAETRLSDVGVSPRNGWIADYPVTPDIIGELRQAVGDAADAGKVPFSRDEALQRFDRTLSASGLSITPYSPEGSNEPVPPGSENYPNPAIVNNYYYNEGPPVVTCYTPPPDFYYLYAWVPSPFWWSGFWFPGFFVLHDFHRTIIVDRRPAFVSNHFRDVRAHRAFRIDPDERFRGRSFGGIGAHTRGLLPTGIPRSERRIFNQPAPRNVPRGVMIRPPALRSRSMTPPPRRGTTVTPPAPRARMVPPSSRGGAAVTPPSRSGPASPVPRDGGETRGPFHSGGSAGRGQRR
jgi:hypothetical protein